MSRPTALVTDPTLTITITTPTAGAEIYYTTDGSTPTLGSTKYTAAIVLQKSTVRGRRRRGRKRGEEGGEEPEKNLGGKRGNSYSKIGLLTFVKRLFVQELTKMTWLNQVSQLKHI